MYPVDLLKVRTKPTHRLSRLSDRAVVPDPDAGRQPLAHRRI